MKREKDKPDFLGEVLTNQKCFCGKNHETLTGIKSPKHGLVWRIESPCHRKALDRIENAFNKMNLDDFFKKALK